MSAGLIPIVIDFSKYKGLVVVRGENRDVGKRASNGSGKSMTSDAILFCLFGKTTRGISGDECVNNALGKNCKVELWVDDLKVARSRKPNRLRVWQNNEEITHSTMPRTQKWLNEKLGVNFNTAVNLLCFGQHNSFSFIDSDTKTKRQLVENLLSLEEYDWYLGETQNAISETKSRIKQLSQSYESLQEIIQDYTSSITNYKKQLAESDATLNKEIVTIKSRLVELDTINTENLLQRWNEHEEAQKSVQKVKAKLASEKSKFTVVELEKSRAESDLIKSKNKQDSYKKLKSGTKCDKCFSSITEENKENAVLDEEKKVERFEKQVVEYGKIAEPIADKIKDLTKTQFELLNVKRPKISKDELGRIEANKQSNLELLKVKENQIGKNPYNEIILDLNNKASNAKEELEKTKFELEAKEKITKYLKFWEMGFGPNGLRSFVIENIIEILNSRTNYWLQFLIDNKISIEFDKFLEVNIRREDPNDRLTYKQGSGGERRRIDLAIALSFASVMRLSSGSDNNIVFLDEVAENIDEVGILGLYRTLRELSKERTVFVITHNQFLLDIIRDQTDSVFFVKEDGFTTLAD